MATNSPLVAGRADVRTKLGDANGWGWRQAEGGGEVRPVRVIERTHNIIVAVAIQTNSSAEQRHVSDGT